MSFLENLANGVYEKIPDDSIFNKRKKSDVWKNYVMYQIAETKEPLPFVVCSNCGHHLKHKNGDSTSTLQRHPCYKKRKAEAMDTESPAKKSKNFHISEEMRVSIKESCVKFCCFDLRPYIAVEGDGFKSVAKNMVEVGANSPLPEDFKIEDILPHRTTVSRYGQKVHQRELKKLVEVIKPIIERGDCGATTDLWTSDLNKKNYLTLTVHYLDDSWEMQSRVLFTVHYPSVNEDGEARSKSAENLRNFLDTIFCTIGLPGAFDQLVFVTDQGSNLVKMLRDQTRLSCAAHLLNTVLRNAFDSEHLEILAPTVNNTIKNTKALVENFKRTAKEEALPHALKQECQTRWNTKFDMLDGVCKNYTAIKEILEKRRELDKIKGIDDYVLQRLVNLLKPFKTATKRLESEKNATLHMVMVTIEELKTELQTFASEESHSEMLYVAERCENFIRGKFIFQDLQKVAAFLWPGFQDLNFLNKAEQKRVRNLVTGELQKIAEKDGASADGSDSFSDDSNGEMKSLQRFRNKPKKKKRKSRGLRD